MNPREFESYITQSLKKINDLQIAEDKKGDLYKLIEETIVRHYSIEKNSKESKANLEKISVSLSQLGRNLKEFEIFIKNLSKNYDFPGFSQN